LFSSTFTINTTEEAEAYMLLEEDLIKETAPFRLLETDYTLTLPVHRTIQIIVTSNDVLHS